MKKFSIVSAFTKRQRGIGIKNRLPWRIKEDMDWFKKLTTSGTVIMGRNTWDSLPEKYKPLPDRRNVILSKNRFSSSNEFQWEYDPVYQNTLWGTGLNTVLPIEQDGKYRDNYVIGGASVYEQSIIDKRCDELYLTEIDEDVYNGGERIECDTFFPKIPKHFRKVKEIRGKTPGVTFQIWKNWTFSESPEHQYIDMLRDIIDNGEEKKDRTGIGTKSLFGKQLRFSLENETIPLLTTKKVWYKGVVEELLFFLRGDHDNRKLKKKGVHIWDGNTSREYLDRYDKKHIETDDLGLAYGVQWRAAGAKLQNIDTDYRGKGVDQIQECIDLIKYNPASRRILFHAWNIQDRDDMALVPCHIMYQFYVHENGKLDCMMTQR